MTKEVKDAVIVENEVENTAIEYTAQVMSVRSADKFGNRRISITVNTKFPGFDEKGNQVETDSFTIDGGQVLHAECDEPLVQVVKYKALERPVNKSVLAGLLNGGIITFTRELKTPEDIRQNGENYSTTQYVTNLVKIQCNISDVIKPFLINDIQNNLFEKEPVKPSINSIFANATASIQL